MAHTNLFEPKNVTSTVLIPRFLALNLVVTIILFISKLGIKAVLKILLEKSTKIYQTNTQHSAVFTVGYMKEAYSQ